MWHPFLRTAITLITGNILLPFLVTIISLVRLWNRFHRLASSSWTEGAPTSSLWQLVDKLVDGPRQESRCSGTSDILTFNHEPLYIQSFSPNNFHSDFPHRMCAPLGSFLMTARLRLWTFVSEQIEQPERRRGPVRPGGWARMAAPLCVCVAIPSWIPHCAVLPSTS